MNRNSPDDSTTLPARYIGVLAEYLGSCGVDATQVLKAARIRSIEKPEAQVSLAQLEAVLAAAEAATGREDLGFELGKRLDPTTHDILGYALLTSPTLAQQLKLAMSYQRLMQRFFSMRLMPTAAGIEIVYRPLVTLSPRAMRVLQEAILVSNHMMLATTLDERMPRYSATLSIPRPAHAARYHELGQVRVNFGDSEPGLRIALPAAALECPLELANPRAMRAIEQRCRTLLQKTSASRRWGEWCRTMLMLHESEYTLPTLEQLAGMVNVSPRTLARYLAAEGASFRNLALQVRTARARELLQQGELSVTLVAYRLGYTDVASFVRSFRAQTGMTPGSMRRSPR